MNVTQSEIDSLVAAAESLAGEGETPRQAVGGAAGPESPPPVRPGGELPPHTQRILRMRVPVIVKLAERDMPVAEVLKITGGSILEFDHPADAELDLLVNNKTIGRGQAVKVGENFGLKVTRMSDVRETITALGD